jgi:hypothetical protein
MERLTMKTNLLTKLSVTLVTFPILAIGAVFTSPTLGQNADLQQKIAALKEGAAANKQALTQYTYKQTTTISIKGDVKKVTHDQVVTGPDGKPQKTSLDPPAAATAAPSGGRLKQHVIAKKKEEFAEYADSIKSLIAQYVPPNKDMIQQAAGSGNIKLGPAGAPGEFQLVISNYVKQGDKMTFAINKAAGGMQSIMIATYLDKPSDAVTVDVQFAQIPSGPRYPATQKINGASKQMIILVQNSDYKHL